MLGGMKITFGWGLDGAAWDEGAAGVPEGTATLGRVTVGPTGLLEILRTRLGLRGPEIPRPMRIAAYRAALADSAHPWCAESFSVDPWAVAKRMLAWRDELVAAGWDGTLTTVDMVNADAGAVSTRVAALAAAEKHFDAPGMADALREVVARLSDLVAGGGWPLGIDSVDIRGDVADLPVPWPGVFRALEALGVDVTTVEEAAPLGRLDIVTAATEWEAAESAARILATSPGTSLVATHHTEVLDHELARRGLPRAGLSETSDQRATAQIVPIFLAAVTSPIDVHAVAALLDLKVTVSNIESGAVRPVGVFTSEVRHAFLAALTQQPGVGGPAWRKVLDAFRRAVAELPPEEKDSRAERERNLELAESLDGMLGDRALSFVDGTCPTATIIASLEWLSARLRVLGGALNAPELLRAAGSVTTTIEVLRDRHSVGEQELSRIVADCCTEDPSPLTGPEAWSRPRRTSPALISAQGPVLWWGAVDPAQRQRRIWTPVEVEQLAAMGVVVPDPAAIARARSRANLNGLRRAGHVIAVVPRSINGAATTIHPLLAFAAADVAAGAGATYLPAIDATGSFDVEKLLKSLTGDAAEQVADGTWTFGQARLSVRTPATWRPDGERIEAESVERAVTPGTQLLPARLSFSQIEHLLMHRLEWLLGRRLEVRTGWQSDIPTGNRMIGSFLHAIVEEIVATMQDRGDFEVTAATVDALFDQLLPHYASELALPGKARLHGQVRNEALTAIPAMFTMLREAGMTVTGAEKGFEKDLELMLRAPGDDRSKDLRHTVTIVGYRDLDAQDATGPVVVDMKYSMSRKRFPELVAAGRALQLATYAWSVTNGDGDTLPLASVTSAYFELKFARFASTDARLSDIESNGPDLGTLWERAVAGIEHALSQIAFEGLVRDEANSLILRTRDETDGGAKEIVERVAGAADMVGRFLPVEGYKYLDYGIITGIEADLS